MADSFPAEHGRIELVLGNIVEHWHRLGEHRPTVVFTINVAHSIHIRNEFRLSGVLAEHTAAHRAVRGHPFGHDLPENDKAALIAFLKTL